ncbi:Gfo/Idh/MocA family oxidoreductase [Mucilaginibacter sp.]|uniref:Gfo/Idh/MocA family protein n=1 Tax=Mucilaginibacter sp. TaxID=1882438 RepID=UPI0026118186|nr:Gfo/Idh/MocA family oxidoreductase [Mucilaginibacter sp.]MDB4926913.1 oxidoreductase [Mucilaginibacter sp.]
MSTIKWGIIGCGDVTEKKSGPPLYKVPNSSLVAVMRRNGEKAADYARRHNVAKWYNDADKLMDDPEINSVYIASPPGSHLGYALAALKKNLNVYLEKPITLNAAEARTIADAVKQSKGKLSVAHYRRALPMFLYVKELIDNGSIGDIRTVQIRLWQSITPELVTHVEDNWRIQAEHSGGGYFHDMSPHQLDLMLFYFGEPQYYSGASLNQGGTYKVADHATGHIVFKNKVVVNGSWSFNVAPSAAVDLCEIIGNKGTITFPFFNKPHLVKLENEAGESTKEFKHPEHISQLMIEKVVNYFNGDDTNNPCSIEDAIPLMDIMDAFGEWH